MSNPPIKKVPIVKLFGKDKFSTFISFCTSRDDGKRFVEEVINGEPDKEVEVVLTIDNVPFDGSEFIEWLWSNMDEKIKKAGQDLVNDELDNLRGEAYEKLHDLFDYDLAYKYRKATD